MTLAQIDFADVIAWNSTFAGDYTHQITDLHPIARSDSHEKARHPTRCSSGTIAVRRSRLRGWSSVLGHRASLSALALQQV